MSLIKCFRTPFKWLTSDSMNSLKAQRTESEQREFALVISDVQILNT